MLGRDAPTTCISSFAFIFDIEEKVLTYSEMIYKYPLSGIAGHLYGFNFMSNLSFTCHLNVGIGLSETTVRKYE